MMKYHECHCQIVEEDLVRSVAELRSRYLVQPSLSNEALKRSFRRCTSCRRKPGNKKCLGWEFNLLGNNAIYLRQTQIGGRWVQAVVTGTFEFKRTSKDIPRPVRASCALEIWRFSEEEGRIAEDAPYSRHHLDLANRGQPDSGVSHDQLGPVWHLQLGGLHSRGGRMPNEWLDVPRWPSLPMNFILVMELAIYSLFPEAWQDLRLRNPWRDIVKRSERLMITDYRERLCEYFEQHLRDEPERASWLSFQCNRTGGWDPRQP